MSIAVYWVTVLKKLNKGTVLQKFDRGQQGTVLQKLGRRRFYRAGQWKALQIWRIFAQWDSF